MIAERPLEGLSVGISISESVDAASRGYSSDEVNRTVIAISEALIAQGARLVFGHDWRPGGVMDAVFDFALGYTPGIIDTEGDRDPLITNFIAAPDEPAKSRDELELYSNTLQVLEIDPPMADIAELGDVGARERDVITRSMTLTEMRRRMAETTDARICVGGRATGSAGRCAGIVEEAYLTQQAGKALFISGMLGGASAQVIDALSEQPEGELEAFRAGDDVAAALSSASLGEYSGETILSSFRSWGVDAIADGNKLSDKENLKLFHARRRTQVLDLVIRGLKRLKQERQSKDKPTEGTAHT